MGDFQPAEALLAAHNTISVIYDYSNWHNLPKA